MLTGIKLSGHGGAAEVARSTRVLELLVVAVEGIGSVCPHGVGEIARLVHLDCSAVSPSLCTCPVQSCLQFVIRGLLIGHTPLLELPSYMQCHQEQRNKDQKRLCCDALFYQMSRWKHQRRKSDSGSSGLGRARQP